VGLIAKEDKNGIFTKSREWRECYKYYQKGFDKNKKKN
jgi:hypothetical protein